MKKIFLLLILLMVSFLLLSCKDDEQNQVVVPTVENNYLEKPNGDVTPYDYSVLENIKIAEGVIINNPYFKTITTGKALTDIAIITNEQSVYSEKIVFNDEILYFSVTTSKYKNEAVKRHYLSDKVLMQQGEIIAWNSVDWNGEISEHSYDYIKDNIGYIPNILTGYIINEESIIETSVIENTNYFYTAKIILNPSIACAVTQKEIKYNSGALELPKYEYVELIVHMNENWQVQQIIMHDIYELKVKLGVKITAPIDSTITETFYYLTQDELKAEISKGAITNVE